MQWWRIRHVYTPHKSVRISFFHVFTRTQTHARTLLTRSIVFLWCHVGLYLVRVFEFQRIRHVAYYPCSGTHTTTYREEGDELLVVQQPVAVGVRNVQHLLVCFRVVKARTNNKWIEHGRKTINLNTCVEKRENTSCDNDWAIKKTCDKNNLFLLNFTASPVLSILKRFWL